MGINKIRYKKLHHTLLQQEKKALLKHETDLNEKYHELFNIVHNRENLSENILHEFEIVKNELENLEKEKSRGIIMRSKAKMD